MYNKRIEQNMNSVCLILNICYTYHKDVDYPLNVHMAATKYFELNREAKYLKIICKKGNGRLYSVGSKYTLMYHTLKNLHVKRVSEGNGNQSVVYKLLVFMMM